MMINMAHSALEQELFSEAMEAYSDVASSVSDFLELSDECKDPKILTDYYRVLKKSLDGIDLRKFSVDMSLIQGLNSNDGETIGRYNRFSITRSKLQKAVTTVETYFKSRKIEIADI